MLFTYAVRLVLALGRVAGGDAAYTAVFAYTKIHLCSRIMYRLVPQATRACFRFLLSCESRGLNRQF